MVLVKDLKTACNKIQKVSVKQHTHHPWHQYKCNHRNSNLIVKKKRMQKCSAYDKLHRNGKKDIIIQKMNWINEDKEHLPGRENGRDPTRNECRVARLI